MAATSKSGQVTIIGHSNGGLLAKALMLELETQGKTDLVDRVVFFATPQLGTPKAIGTILHGYDQRQLGGLIVNDVVARTVIENLPGAYGLLPTQAYFDTTNSLVVSFDGSETTAPFRSQYGNAVNDLGELVNFMNGADGRGEAETGNDASTANANLLTDAIADHQDRLDTWVAPAGVEVVEIVGVGLDTISGFEYTEFTERICGAPDIFGTQSCTNETFYKPIPQLSQFGDETVIGQSAEGYVGEKTTYYVDLDAIDEAAENGTVTAVEHANFGETQSIQALVNDLLEDRETESEFVSVSRPEFSDNRLLLGSHSPVNMVITDTNGNESGIFASDELLPEVREDVPGSSVFRLGDSTYIVVPADVQFDVEIIGEDEGGMTFTVHELSGASQSLLHKTAVATITASTSIKITKDTETFSNLDIDENGDGVVDIVLDLDGEEVVPEVASYVVLRDQIKALGLTRAHERLLLYKVRLAERFGKKAERKRIFARLEDRFLKQVSRRVSRHEQKGRITETEEQAIITTIELLKDNR